MKKNLTTIFLTVLFLAGLSLLLYPTFSDYWNSFHQSRAIASYSAGVATLDDKDYEKYLQAAEQYNKEFSEKPQTFVLTEEELEQYKGLLDVTGNGIMGYIEIPAIKCSLPIYHGTDEAVLQIAVGHVEGTSLPIGGESTHTVLSGHRGLPSARLFTDIDQLNTGDEFMIRVLDETLTYEVDQILIVLPSEVEALEISEGKDLCTLVTCTPYGINTHRLLVRGHRVETVNKLKIRVTADAVQIDPTIVTPVIAVPLLLILMIFVLATTGKKKQK